MSKLTLSINGVEHDIDVPASMPLLWVLRDVLNLTGTKFSCGEGQCGACTVHIDGEARRSCVTPVSKAAGHAITTIEGLSPAGEHPLQKAWLEEQVVQCGYCQPGQIMAAAALLAKTPQPSDAEIDEVMGDVLCRCGSYQRIRRAIHRATDLAAELEA
jgi:isoquinoline 1-oxidoreductase alpha subunit